MTVATKPKSKLTSNRWDLLCPAANLLFDHTSSEFRDFDKDVLKIPGVKHKNGVYTVPVNALSIVERVRDQYGVPLLDAAWKTPITPPSSWDQIEAILKEKQEVQPWVLDGFLLAYQKEAINFSWNKSGVHLWHPTGCIAGISRLLVQECEESGKIVRTFRTTIAELYSLFHNTALEPAPDSSSYVYKVQSVDENGQLFWNTIEMVHSCGLKPVARIISSVGNAIEATAQHRFMVAEQANTSSKPEQTFLSLGEVSLQTKLSVVKFSLLPDHYFQNSENPELSYKHRVEAAHVTMIKSVGTTNTFDLTMNDRANNYVSEDFVVHNSGKTLTGIIAGMAVDGPMLIVTRAASRIQYAREVEKFTKLKAHIIRPSSELRKKSITFEQYIDTCAQAKQRPVLVVGWESLADNLDKINAINPGVVIYDEAHRGKNSKRWDIVNLPDLPENEQQALEQLRKDKAEAQAKNGFIKDTEDGRKLFIPHVSTATAAADLSRMVKKRILTTATPIKNKINDLWAQLDMAEPNAWGSATAWQDRHCDRKPGRYGGFDVSGESNVDELNERLKSCAHILSQFDTHRHLPAKRRQSFYIAPEDQCKPLAGFAKEIKRAQERGATAVLEVKLAEAASRKRKAVMSLVEDHLGSNHKIVIFTARKADCEELGDEVRKLQIVKSNKIQVWHAHGELSVKSRQDLVDSYMSNDGACVLVATGQAFGESLNLQDTDAAIFTMIPYDPGNLKQWEGRFTRNGQKRPVTIYYAIAVGTVDEHVAAILIDKLPAVEKVVKDEELAAAESVLAGVDPNQSPEQFAQSILDCLDFD